MAGAETWPATARPDALPQLDLSWSALATGAHYPHVCMFACMHASVRAGLRPDSPSIAVGERSKTAASPGNAARPGVHDPVPVVT
jgi:hypothetical protein